MVWVQARLRQCLKLLFFSFWLSFSSVYFDVFSFRLTCGWVKTLSLKADDESNRQDELVSIRYKNFTGESPVWSILFSNILNDSGDHSHDFAFSFSDPDFLAFHLHFRQKSPKNRIVPYLMKTLEKSNAPFLFEMNTIKVCTDQKDYYGWISSLRPLPLNPDHKRPW